MTKLNRAKYVCFSSVRDRFEYVKEAGSKSHYFRSPFKAAADGNRASSPPLSLFEAQCAISPDR